MARSQIEDLMSIADDHDGLITTVDARNAGISPMTLVKMADRGRLERLHRGVYRLPLYPLRAENCAKLHQALAWAESGHGPRAVISHESALALFRLSDALPNKVHLTVPKRTRFQRRTIPPHLVIHRADLSDENVTIYQGVRVTTPEQSILDVYEAGRADFAWQAIDDAQSHGFMTAESARKMSDLLRARFDK